MAERRSSPATRTPPHDGGRRGARAGAEAHAERPIKLSPALDRLDLSNMNVIQAARCLLTRAIVLLK